MKIFSDRKLKNNSGQNVTLYNFAVLNAGGRDYKEDEDVQ